MEHYRKSVSFSDRCIEANNILQKYPDRIPVICERDKKASYDCPDIDKRKYLVPNDLTLGQFIFIIRKRLKISPEKALFLFVNGTIHCSAHLVSLLYEYNKDDDGFLYITYTFENTFGAILEK
jgi:GABA(A) receptor-associated protein